MSRGHLRRRIRNIHALEMWVWRRMLRINWTQRKTNISVKNKVGVKESLLRSRYKMGKTASIGQMVDSKWLKRLQGDANGLGFDYTSSSYNQQLAFL